MVYVELTESQMIQDLTSDDNASWTYNQAEAIANFFIEMYGDDGSFEWDPVGIRCEFSGYNSKKLKTNTCWNQVIHLKTIL